MLMVKKSDKFALDVKKKRKRKLIMQSAKKVTVGNCAYLTKRTNLNKNN